MGPVGFCRLLLAVNLTMVSHMGVSDTTRANFKRHATAEVLVSEPATEVHRSTRRRRRRRGEQRRRRREIPVLACSTTHHTPYTTHHTHNRQHHTSWAELSPPFSLRRTRPCYILNNLLTPSMNLLKPLLFFDVPSCLSSGVGGRSETQKSARRKASS